MAECDIPDGWQARGTPPTLSRRFPFPDYPATRRFLDALAALSEQAGVHPQTINFGSGYVNVTLDATADGAADAAFARRIDALLAQG